ncbi:MAG: redoxin domain-containing protein [Pseudomonadota bacterium]
MTRILPGQDLDTPLHLDLIIGTRWDLEKQADDMPWRMVVVYRGLHCPLCKKQLKDLSNQLRDFVDAGCVVVTASMDSEERAKKAHSDWELGDLPLAFELSEDTVRAFGLYVSESISDNEPAKFAEPAILLFKHAKLYAAWIQSVPFARPAFEDVRSAMAFIDDKDYPPRGTA